jgi:protein-tyrosine phosphatase
VAKKKVIRSMDKMIDIHAHLIPEFDDGPKSFDEAVDMLQQAADQGISDVFATSHFNEWIPAEVEKEYFNKLKKLKERAAKKNIKITIYSGAEIFYHQYVENTVRSGKVTTLGNWKQYVLIEFPMFQMPEGAEEILFRLTAENFIPIIAHPERYVMVIGRAGKIKNFLKYGGLLQLNGGSILGYFGKEIQKTAMQLLEKQVVHFIASDAHSSGERRFLLREVFNFLETRIPSEYLMDILYRNQQKIVDNIRMEAVNLSELAGKDSFFQSFRKRWKFSS